MIKNSHSNEQKQLSNTGQCKICGVYFRYNEHIYLDSDDPCDHGIIVRFTKKQEEILHNMRII